MVWVKKLQRYVIVNVTLLLRYIMNISNFALAKLTRKRMRSRNNKQQTSSIIVHNSFTFFSTIIINWCSVQPAFIFQFFELYN